MVEIYTAPYIEAASEGTNKIYGHGIWICKGTGLDAEEYISGEDAGVSFYSEVTWAKSLLVTAMSNTTGGAWPILRAIQEVLKGHVI